MPTAIPRRSPWRRRLDTPGWGLVPLRAFLGGTFLFAGLQKLADHSFFTASSPSSIQAQLHSYAQASPVGGVIAHVTHQAVLLGVVIAVAELAVGLGTLLGLWSRVAAVGGALLSLGFLLTVSWHSRPYYYGADIVFLAAWLPLAIVGDGGVLSLRTWLRERERVALGAPYDGAVSIQFVAVSSLCGAYDAGRCRFRDGAPCEPAPCPVLGAGPRPRTALVESLDRRAFLATARAAGVVAVGAAGLGVVAATVGRLVAPKPSDASGATALGAPTLDRPRTTATTAPSTAPTTAPVVGSTEAPVPAPSSTTVAVRPSGTPIGAVSDVAPGAAAAFDDPASGDPAFVVRRADGSVQAFSALCTHEGCTVRYTGSDFACPCHGARFSVTDGSATRGPARSPLPAIAVTVGPDGQIYAT